MFLILIQCKWWCIIWCPFSDIPTRHHPTKHGTEWSRWLSLGTGWISRIESKMGFWNVACRDCQDLREGCPSTIFPTLHFFNWLSWLMMKWSGFLLSYVSVDVFLGFILLEFCIITLCNIFLCRFHWAVQTRLSAVQWWCMRTPMTLEKVDTSWANPLETQVAELPVVSISGPFRCRYMMMILGNMTWK